MQIKQTYVLFFVAFGLLVFAGTLPNSGAQEPQGAMEEQVLYWTNYYRSHFGRRPLRLNAQLNVAAKQHAQAMANQELMAHTINDKTVVNRVRQHGYVHQVVGENIGYSFGYENPAWRCFSGWMYSPSHWRNIQSLEYTETGLGVSESKSGKLYFCQIFAIPAHQEKLIRVPSSPFVAETIPARPQRSQPARTNGRYPNKASGLRTYPQGLSAFPAMPHALRSQFPYPRVRTTLYPNREGLFIGLGGLQSFPVGTGDYYEHPFQSYVGW
ncbi:MAG: CAP domain-containing protein [Gemmataceae bacterium]